MIGPLRNKIIVNLHSSRKILCLALVLGTVLVANATVLSANAQGPPAGAPASQLASLTDRWWKWILSLDTTSEPNPFAITYEGDCSQLIQGKTMFLVGQAGTAAPDPVDHGTCIVPSGTSILFPLVNFVNVDCKIEQQRGKPAGLCTMVKQTPALGQPYADLREEPNEFIDQVTSLVATLDGVSLEAVRVQSPPGGFGVRLSEHNALFGELGPGGAGLEPFGFVSLHSVVDGYWVLLPPLPPGEHELVFGACSPAGCQTNIYTLVVR